MFDKTKKTQSKLERELSTLVQNSTLPRSLLFSGSEYSGRLTAVFETIEALIGTDLYKNTSNIFLYLSRDVSVDFEAKASIYLYSLTESAFKNIKDALLVVILSSLYSSLRAKDSAKAMFDKERETELLNIYTFLCANANSSESKNAVLRAKEIVKDAKPNSLFSIEDVRLFKESSALYSNNDKGKFYIIEGLGDASSGAKNAFLKLLEEPPENSYFFIIEKEKAILGETLLSRLSPFYFRPFSNELKNEVIASYNDDGSLYTSLSDFFLSRGFEESKKIKASAYECAVSVLKNNTHSPSERNKARSFVKEIFQRGLTTSSSLVVFKLFLNEFIRAYNDVVLTFPLLLNRSEVYIKYLNDAKIKVLSYNQNPRNVLFVLIDNLIDLCYNM